MIARKIFLFFLSSSVVACSISVSLSQGFLFLAFISLLFSPKEKWQFSNIFLYSILFWLGEFSILAIHWVKSDYSIEYLKNGMMAENKDFFLYLGFICMANLKDSEIPKLEKAVKIFAVVLVVTGFISIFSDYRLGWLIGNLTKKMTSWGFQHNYLRWNFVSINLPIGLMNTHLTYGGLLLLVYPWILLNTILNLQKKDTYFRKLVGTLFLISASIIFLLNNARSSMAGALVSLSIGIYIWHQKGFKFPISIKRIVYIFTAILLLSIIAWSQSEPFQRITAPLMGSEKHTDSGRTFIWDSTFVLIQQNLLLGVGPGNYPTQIEISRKQRSSEFPELLFFYETTQRGHAHNDYYHILAVFGIFVLFIYLALAYFSAYTILNTNLPFERLILYIGILGFFVAGLLQCYFQDDEVVIFFWFLLGLFVRSNQLIKISNSKESIKTN